MSELMKHRKQNSMFKGVRHKYHRVYEGKRLVADVGQGNYKVNLKHLTGP